MAARGSQSLQVKRKIYFRQEEEVEEYCLITYLDEPGSHSICKKTKLFDLVNLSSGKDSASIMYENRQYKVLILRTGSKKLIKRLLEKYEDNESIKTADDSDATKKLGNDLKKVRLEPKNSKSEQCKSSQHVSEPKKSSISITPLPKKNKELVQKVLHKSDDDDENLNDNKLTNENRSHENSDFSDEDLTISKKKFKTTLNKSNESLDNDTNEFQKIWKELAEFKKKFDQRQDRNFESDYMHDGKNLVTEFKGKNPVKWAISVVDHLFTEQELRENTLLESNRTERGSLSPARVEKLRISMVKRFNLSPVKASKWFEEVKDHVNTKGRNLKRKFKAQSNTTIS